MKTLLLSLALLVGLASTASAQSSTVPPYPYCAAVCTDPAAVLYNYTGPNGYERSICSAHPKLIDCWNRAAGGTPTTTQHPASTWASPDGASIFSFYGIEDAWGMASSGASSVSTPISVPAGCLLKWVTFDFLLAASYDPAQLKIEYSTNGGATWTTSNFYNVGAAPWGPRRQQLVYAYSSDGATGKTFRARYLGASQQIFFAATSVVSCPGA